MVFACRALAIALVAVAHVFGMAIGHASSAGIAVAYALSIVALAAAAIMLWRRTMNLQT